jgi:hypothetical protein
MAANVTLRGKFFGDARFKALGLYLGVDHRIAAYEMASLWSWQTEQHRAGSPAHVVDEVELIGRFGADGPAALVRAKLAREVEPGRYYIHGTQGDDDGKGDIGWLAKKREAGRKGGTAGDKVLPRKGSGEGRNQAPAEAPPKHDTKQNGSTDEAPSNPQDLGSGIQSSPSETRESAPGEPALTLAPPGPKQRRKREQKPETTCPNDLAPNERQRSRAAVLGVDADQQFRLFRAHHGSRGNLFRDWSMAFDKWLENAPTYSRAGPLGPLGTRDHVPAPTFRRPTDEELGLA